MTEDEWWETLPPERKRQIRGWLDPDNPDRARAEAANHPDQLPLLPVEALGWRA